MINSKNTTETNVNEPHENEENIPVTIRFSKKQLHDIHAVIEARNLYSLCDAEDDDLENFIREKTMSCAIVSCSIGNIIDDKEYYESLKKAAALKKAEADNSSSKQ